MITPNSSQLRKKHGFSSSPGLPQAQFHQLPSKSAPETAPPGELSSSEGRGDAKVENPKAAMKVRSGGFSHRVSYQNQNETYGD